jgi:hypothetical protein
LARDIDPEEEFTSDVFGVERPMSQDSTARSVL